MGITGTWDGFVATAGYIYNRGNWRSGYGSLSAINVSNGHTINIYNESSAVRIVSTGPSNNETYPSNHVEVQLNNAINFTPYSNVAFTLSGCAGGRWNSHGQFTKYTLHCYIVNPSGTSLVSTFYEGETYNPGVAELTMSINVSNINVTGYLRMEFVDLHESGGMSQERANTTSYIHIIRLS